MADHRSLAADLVASLKKQGADACDVYITESSRFNTTVRLAKVEKLGQSTSKGLGLRVFKKGATALTFTTDFGSAALKQLVRDTLDIVKVSTPDKDNGLAAKEYQGVYDGRLMMFDDSAAAMSVDRKIAIAREAEEAGRSVDKRITNSNGGNWRDTTTKVTIANSDGFVNSYRTTTLALHVGLVAEQDGVKQSDSWYTVSRYAKHLESARAVGEKAGQRTVRRLGARKPKSQTVPVVFDPEAAAGLVQAIFEAATGPNIYRKASFLVDKAGQQIASPLIDIVDDATIPDGPGSRPFDAECVKSSSVIAVEKGVLKTYICHAYSGRRLGLKPTGNASRAYQIGPTVGASNLFLKPGSSTAEEIVKSVKSGLYVTDLFSQGLNPVTGDMSRGALGFWIENGEIAYPVQEITIAGNMSKMMQAVSMVGNDLTFRRGSVASPTLLVSEMTVAGA